MHQTTDGTRAAADHGINYDPTLEAAEHGIAIQQDAAAADVGSFCRETRVIRVRPLGPIYYRSTATYQLAYALDEDRTKTQAVEFAAERLIDCGDLEAIASVTDNRRLWAKVLRVRECLLAAHLAIRLGLPIAANA